MSPEREARIVEGLRTIAERCSEALAAAEDWGQAGAVEGSDIESARQNIADINREVWRLRWDILLGSGDTKLETKAEAAQ